MWRERLRPLPRSCGARADGAGVVAEAVAAGRRAVVLIGPYEHHSNILPWRESGAEVPEDAVGGIVLTEAKDTPAMPSKAYLEGILNGCRQNGIEIAPVLEAVWLTQKELPKKAVPQKKHHRRKSGEER